MVRKSSLATRLIIVALLLSLISTLALVTPQKAARAQDAEITLTFAAYTTPREVYAEMIPLFQKYWLEKTGKKVVFKESYQASGAQSRAIVGGFEADIAALSLEADITRLVNAKLITHDWKANDYRGITSTSIVTLAVQKGNPKKITDWTDLTQPGLQILTPDPATSGGAQWNILAAVGAVKRGKIKGYDATEEGALKFVGDVFKNVTVLDKGARESILNFEKGVGDVAITYENEILSGRLAGATYEPVYLSSTLLIETPIAVIDANVDKHGTREVAEAFLKFLWTTPEVQAIWAKYGYRPAVNKVTTTATPAATQAADAATAGKFPVPADLFTIEYLGGWAKAGPEFFGENGKVTKVITEIQSK